MKINKTILLLLIIIAVLVVIIGWEAYTYQDNSQIQTNNTTIMNNTTVKNATAVKESTTSTSESGQYGYCAICGKALTYEEAHDEYTQGKVCHSCAANPYYETPEGADYANQKLAEAYPEDFEGTYYDVDGNYEDDYY